MGSQKNSNENQYQMDPGCPTAANCTNLQAKDAEYSLWSAVREHFRQ
jgi:hypothetical protein